MFTGTGELKYSIEKKNIYTSYSP